MNIEDFFIEKYKELEDKNNKLVMELLKHSKEEHEFGVFPTDNNLCLVKVKNISYWDMDSGIFAGKNSQEIEKLKSKIDNAFNWNVGYGSKAITVDEQVFPFSFCVKLPGKTIRYAVDNNGITENINDADEPILSSWCNAELLDELKDMAKQELLHEMDKRIERLRKDEEKE